ncbi:hypothetical protein CSHISOI_08499 [Colletotrichum shisoi]|uniref:Uncharacterized protein n=1 Tax=Colletotrichum shisoi TaxID=2078593 RepID=A0A5Q4BK46_9PEZI|nr:hypothetical protein CSHISOI_08499 [Colletotrichum shisoi]
MAAIIRVILIFHPTGQFGPGAMWSLREDFVAIFVGQAPMIVPLFKKKFWTQKGYRYTPKSSQRSDGIEMSSGASNPNKKSRDPFSLTQLGFTHITNLTRATQNTQTDVTAVAKHSSEALAVTEEEAAEPSQDGVVIQNIVGGIDHGTKNSLEISVVPVVTESDDAGAVDGKNG